MTALENYGLIAITAENDDTIHLAAAEKNPDGQGRYARPAGSLGEGALLAP